MDSTRQLENKWVNRATVTLPPVPDDVPIKIDTSFGHDHPPQHYGIAPDDQWWCEAVRLSRQGEARVCVYPPGQYPEGAGRAGALVTVRRDATDDDETRDVATFAIKVTRCLVRFMADGRDSAAQRDLARLYAGPLAQSQWGRTLAWLYALRAGKWAPLEL